MREGVYGGFTAYLYLPFCQINGGILTFDPEQLSLDMIALHVGFGRRDSARKFGFNVYENQRRIDGKFTRGWSLRIRLGGKGKVFNIPGPQLWTKYANWLQGGR